VYNFLSFLDSADTCKVCIMWSIFRMLTTVFHSQNIILLIFLRDIIMSGLRVRDRVVVSEARV
jgi:hypothetical protein